MMSTIHPTLKVSAFMFRYLNYKYRNIELTLDGAMLSQKLQVRFCNVDQSKSYISAATTHPYHNTIPKPLLSDKICI